MARTTIAYLQSAGTERELPPLPDAQMEIVATVADDGHGKHTGLAAALHRIAAGEADTLFVARLQTAAGSPGALLRLLDWLEAAGAGLLAADVELDTRDRAGRKSVALLREVERWGREGDAARRPRGRPGLSEGAPAVAQRIALLRERGQSLRSIAETLDQEGIPTPRGGTRWRASSVQSALGYRRPCPPAPGAPPAPGPPPPAARVAAKATRAPPRPGDPRERPGKPPGGAGKRPPPGDGRKHAPRGAAHPPSPGSDRGAGPPGRPAGKSPRGRKKP